MKHTLLSAFALSLLSTSAFATMEFTCTGDDAEETLQFSISDVDAINLDQVSSGLTKGLVSINPEEGEDPQFLSKEENQAANKKKVTFSDWNGNWGFTLDIPAKVADGHPVKSFKINYLFNYDDIETATVDRVLDCKYVQ